MHRVFGFCFSAVCFAACSRPRILMLLNGSFGRGPARKYFKPFIVLYEASIQAGLSKGWSCCFWCGDKSDLGAACTSDFNDWWRLIHLKSHIAFVSYIGLNVILRDPLVLSLVGFCANFEEKVTADNRLLCCLLCFILGDAFLLS